MFLKSVTVSKLQEDFSKIIIVIPYFGAWPFWMPFFFRSCSLNPTVNWLIYTDCDSPDNTPNNVVIKNISYSDYCQLVSERLGFTFNPPNAYKLCDLKPALGFVHAEDLVGYDFWAFGDIDLIYGDLRKYFTEARLKKRHLLSTHKRRVSGHLCLLRNNNLMRTAFKRIPNWKSRLSDHEHHALDEGAFSRLFMGHKNWPDWLRHLAEKFSKWSRRSEFIESHSTYTLLPSGEKVIPECWNWRNGHLMNSDMPGVELPYFHFLFWKNNWRGVSADDLISPPNLHEHNAWRISVNGWNQAELHNNPSEMGGSTHKLLQTASGRNVLHQNITAAGSKKGEETLKT